MLMIRYNIQKIVALYSRVVITTITDCARINLHEHNIFSIFGFSSDMKLALNGKQEDLLTDTRE